MVPNEKFLRSQKAVLEDFRSKLLAGETLRDRDVRGWLKEALSSYTAEVGFVDEIASIPPDLSRYLKLLSKADMEFGQFENLPRGSKAGASVENRSQASYDRAIELLEEITTGDPGLWRFMDRTVNWADHAQAPTACQDDMPRHRASTSRHNLNPLPSLSDIQQRAIELELSAIEAKLSGQPSNEEPAVSPEATARLGRVMGRHNTL